MTDIRFGPRRRPYRVAKLGGGHRTFASVISAVNFAQHQAANSWNDAFWLVTNTNTGHTANVNRNGDVQWN
jgi:hypothetical protein